jgi:hypothetical protein
MVAVGKPRSGPVKLTEGGAVVAPGCATGADSDASRKRRESTPRAPPSLRLAELLSGTLSAVHAGRISATVGCSAPRRTTARLRASYFDEDTFFIFAAGLVPALSGLLSIRLAPNFLRWAELGALDEASPASIAGCIDFAPQSA